MARRNNGIHMWMPLLLAVLLFTAGCAGYQGRKAFETAEQLVAEEKFDQAVEKYFEATQLVPANKTYKLKLIATRTNAAAYHIKRARSLAKEGRIDEALQEYRLARGFDPSLEVATQEERQLMDLRQAHKLADEAAEFLRNRQLTLARKLAQRALEFDPRNERAQTVLDLLIKEQSSVQFDGIELDVASDEPITLRFKDADIKEVFGILAQLTDINFIFDEDIRDQSISVLLEKASFAQAMELILQMNGLGKKVLNSKTIIIYPQTREKEKQYEDQLIQTFYLSHIDAKKAVNMLRTMLQLRKIYVHEERNALVIRDKPDVIRLAEKILDAADRENSEVIFNLELLAVSNTDDLRLGPSLSSYSVSAGLAKQGGSTIVSDTLSPGSQTDNLVGSASGLQTFYTLPTATFDFAKTLTDTEVLASPKIRVRNKEKAKVHIGTREPVISVTTTGDTTSDNIQYVDVGVKVDVEPTIQLDNSVETKLTLEVSQVIDRLETDRGSVALTISTTNAQSTLTLKDGVQTILGGLFEQNSNNTITTVPLLGDIPLIGRLFSGIDDRDTKREILLSITPYIVKQVAIPEIEVATIWSGGEDNLKAGPNFGAFAKPLVSEIEETRPDASPAAKKMTLGTDGGAEVVLVEEPDQEAQKLLEPPPEPVGTGAPLPLAEDVEEPVTASEQIPEAPAGKTDQAEEPPAADGPQDIPEAAPRDRELPETTAATVPTRFELPEPTPAELILSGPRTVETEESFTLTVEVENVNNLYSAPLFVSYDPEMLELTGIHEGGFLQAGGARTIFSSSPNRTTGQIIVGYKQGAGGEGASGSGDLFRLDFRALGQGQTTVSLNRVNFRNPDGTRLTVEPAAAELTIE